MSLNWFVINPWKDDDEVMNIWKSYIWTAEWRIKSSMIIAVIQATFAVAKRKPEKKIIILSRVYNESIQRPAPRWLVSLIGRAMHRYRRGQGLEFPTSLNFFQAYLIIVKTVRILVCCTAVLSVVTQHSPPPPLLTNGCWKPNYFPFPLCLCSNEQDNHV